MLKVVFFLLVFLICGCTKNGTDSEEDGANENITTVLETRNGIAYLPDENERFTGKYEMYYSDGTSLACTLESMVLAQEKIKIEQGKNETERPEPEIEAENKKESGFFKWWRKLNKSKSKQSQQGQKCYDENFIDGKKNGLTIHWDENGQKVYEINYKDGKRNGLETWWCTNNKEKICEQIAYKDGKKDGLEIKWDEYRKRLWKTKYIDGQEAGGLSGQELANATKKMNGDYDAIEEITWYKDKSTSDCCKTGIYLYIGKRKAKNPTLRLKILYYAENWLFIDSFIVVADGKKFDKELAVFKRDNSSGLMWEWHDKLADDGDIEMIKAIIGSKSVVIRLNGSIRYSDYIVTPQEKEAMQNVLDTYEALGGAL